MINLYIANLGKYNEGLLIGEWVELPKSENELQEVYNRIGINEEYEEMAIHDFETDLPIEISEYSNIEKLNDIAEEFNNMNEYEIEIIKAIMEVGYSLEESKNIYDSGDFVYCGECDNHEDLGWYMYQNGLMGFELPEHLETYFDFEKYGRDLTFEGYNATEKGYIYIY